VAIVGAIATLLVTGTPLNASSLMGCVLLVGLVVKNGVLLLEEAERARDLGADAVGAVTHAAERRLRPVLMTTVATLAGLFPLALGIGAGAELQRPLAIAVMGGLLTATAATLVLLPPLAALALRSRDAGMPTRLGAAP
jgi:multidrug efflux pump subunit AcrB